MAIDYNTDILPLYTTNVATDAAYQSPGTYNLPSSLAASDAGKRVLTFVEILRAYMAEIDNVHEAKILQDVLGRLVSAMRFGSTTWDTTVIPANAQKDALRFLASHKIPTDI